MDNLICHKYIKTELIKTNILLLNVLPENGAHDILCIYSTPTVRSHGYGSERFAHSCTVTYILQW